LQVLAHFFAILRGFFEIHFPFLAFLSHFFRLWLSRQAEVCVGATAP